MTRQEKGIPEWKGGADAVRHVMEVQESVVFVQGVIFSVSVKGCDSCARVSSRMNGHCSLHFRRGRIGGSCLAPSLII